MTRPNLMAVDVDYTMSVGNPPGPIKIGSLSRLARQSGLLVVLVGDYRKVWTRTDEMGHIIPACETGSSDVHEMLKALKSEFPNFNHYYVSGNPAAPQLAADTGYVHLDPESFMRDWLYE